MTKTTFDQNDIMTDYSGFKWMSFIPGKHALDDIAVMEIASTQARFSRFIRPDQYFTPTYCIQIVKGGSLNININNTNYELTANQGCLVTPELLVEKPHNLENYVEMLVLSISREFIQELNLAFPLAATSYIYVHPVWNISPKRMERLEQYFHLMREVFDDKDRKAALHLVRSFFYYLAEPELNHFPQQDISNMSRNEEITGRFMQLVDEHCEQHHNLDWYADQLGFLNQSHFGTFFKRHKGMSPAAFRKR